MMPLKFAVCVLVASTISPVLCAQTRPCPVPVITADGVASVETPCNFVASVIASNKVKEPPLVPSNSEACKVALLFKPVVGSDQHAYIVITRPDGTKTELRGGPSKFGVTSTGSPNEQPVGDPFECKTSHNFGVVVPYIGLHGLLGKDEQGKDVYSPDGNVASPTRTIAIDKPMQKNSCTLANCLMQIASAHGKTCQLYHLGVAPRNSNTLLSAALTACGVADPLPADISAPGWYRSWYDK